MFTHLFYQCVFNIMEVAKLKVAVLTKAADQRCIKLPNRIVVTTHLEQRDDNITQDIPYDDRIHQKINYKQRN